MSTTIPGVAVFDGTDLLDGYHDVTFTGSTITSVTPSAGGRRTEGTLLPGLIDAHVHFRSLDQLAELARYGVTTALDMATWPPAFVAELRSGVREGKGCDIRSSGAPLAGAGGTHSRIPGFPADSVVTTAGQARATVATRVAEGSDYIKLILEAPGRGGLEPAVAAAAVAAAHAAELRVVAHASATAAVAAGLEAGADIFTHVPLDAVISEQTAARVRVVVPTLTMMRGVAANLGLTYENARDSVTALHRAGATIVAGTDANDAPGVPAAVAHGSSLHDELRLLVEAGLTPLEALRAATGTAAAAFGLADRGAIREGLRADLLLVGGDPLADITATRDITAAWIAR